MKEKTWVFLAATNRHKSHAAQIYVPVSIVALASVLTILDFPGTGLLRSGSLNYRFQGVFPAGENSSSLAISSCSLQLGDDGFLVLSQGELENFDLSDNGSRIIYSRGIRELRKPLPCCFWHRA